VIGDRSLGSEPADEVMNGIDGNADGSADVDDLEVAGADEPVHRASRDPECSSGIFDGQEQHEAASVVIVGRPCGKAVRDLRMNRQRTGWLHLGPHRGRVVESPELR
jgi:hypothetical protein